MRKILFWVIFFSFLFCVKLYAGAIERTYTFPWVGTSNSSAGYEQWTISTGRIDYEFKVDEASMYFCYLGYTIVQGANQFTLENYEPFLDVNEALFHSVSWGGVKKYMLQLK